ncbi:MAG TPA: hypothetical protein VLY45_03975 [Nitrospiria bacterium]|nr:hypothetical protein [Nitrospiria bacterium]
MNARTYLVLLSVFALWGCPVSHVHTLSRLVVTGRVFDARSNQPLAGVAVTYIDTGFNPVRPQQTLSWAIGESDGAGNVKINFDYWWGAEGDVMTARTRKAFAIELSKAHYSSERLPFDAAELSGTGNELPVNLGNVYLKPETP